MNIPRFSKFKKASFIFPWVLLLGTLVSGSLLVRFLDRVGNQHLREQGANSMEVMTQGIENELNSSHSVVKALAGSPWIFPALLDPSAGNLEKAQSVLTRYNESVSFSVCYLLDLQGTAIASSNKNSSDSFVGKNYAFRPYFQEALSGKTSGYLAAGVTSLERGFYAAQAVKDPAGKILGVVAIKKNVNAIKELLEPYKQSFFVNPDGVIFMSGSPEKVFQALWPISTERVRELKASRQFAFKADRLKPIFDAPVEDGGSVSLEGTSYRCFRRPVFPAGWSLVLLSSTNEILYFRILGWGITGSGVFIMALILFWMSLRFKAMDVLRESQERFRAAFESSGIGMAIVRPEGQWLQANASLCEMLGYSEEELFRMTWQQITYPEDLEQDLEYVRRLIAGEFNDYSMEKRFFHKDGHLLWILLTVALVRSSRGEPLYFISQLEDITRRKEGEEKLVQKIAELERFNRIAVGRELKMIELKAKLKDLEGSRP